MNSISISREFASSLAKVTDHLKMDPDQSITQILRWCLTQTDLSIRMCLNNDSPVLTFALRQSLSTFGDQLVNAGLNILPDMVWAEPEPIPINAVIVHFDHLATNLTSLHRIMVWGITFRRDNINYEELEILLNGTENLIEDNIGLNQLSVVMAANRVDIGLQFDEWRENPHNGHPSAQP